MDDCAFGAMMSLALRPNFRKLRFQMIADTHRRHLETSTGLALPITTKSCLTQPREDLFLPLS